MPKAHRLQLSQWKPSQTRLQRHSWQRYATDRGVGMPLTSHGRAPRRSGCIPRGHGAFRRGSLRVAYHSHLSVLVSYSRDPCNKHRRWRSLRVAYHSQPVLCNKHAQTKTATALHMGLRSTRPCQSQPQILGAPCSKPGITPRTAPSASGGGSARSEL